MNSKIFKVVNAIAFAAPLVFGCSDSSGGNSADGGEDTSGNPRGDGGDDTSDGDTMDSSNDGTHTIDENDICYEIEQGIDEIPPPGKARGATASGISPWMPSRRW